MKFQIPVTFDSASRRKDRSIRMSFSSNREIETAEFSMIDAELQGEGWLLFSPNELQEADIPTGDADTKQGKSKGGRLRAVYFLLWKKKNIDEAFDPWFDRQFEKIMDQIKEKLD